MLFIEEDHYLAEDFILVLRMMYRLKARYYITCISVKLIIINLSCVELRIKPGFHYPS